MTYKQFLALAKKFGGWLEDQGCDEEVIRFPSVHQRQQFEKAVAGK